MSKKNMDLWLSNLEIFRKYINEFNKLPTTITVYEGFKLGDWIKNQKYQLNHDKLTDTQIKMLNSVNSFWNGTTDEKNNENKRLLINSDWKSKIDSDKIPIDELYQDNDLYLCLRYNILDCESFYKLFFNKNNLLNKLSNTNIYECLSKIIPLFDPSYSRLILAICGNRISEDINETKKIFESFTYCSIAEMKSKINQILGTLTEREEKVICLRYGLHDNKWKSLAEIGTILNLHPERIRQIETRALRKLRNPFRLKILYITNTVLDHKSLSRETRARLYRDGMDSEIKVREYFEQNHSHLRINNYDLYEELKDFLDQLSIDRQIHNNKFECTDALNMSLEELNLSVRAYNCLRRSGIKTVNELTNKTIEDMYKVRNLGYRSLEEIINKLKSLGLSLSKEPDDIPQEKTKVQEKTNTQAQNNTYLYNYFVTFIYQDKYSNNTSGTANSFVKTNRKIDSIETLQDITKIIEKHHKITNVVIINFIECN